MHDETVSVRDDVPEMVDEAVKIRYDVPEMMDNEIVEMGRMSLR